MARSPSPRHEKEGGTAVVAVSPSVLLVCVELLPESSDPFDVGIQGILVDTEHSRNLLCLVAHIKKNCDLRELRFDALQIVEELLSHDMANGSFAGRVEAVVHEPINVTRDGIERDRGAKLHLFSSIQAALAGCLRATHRDAVLAGDHALALALMLRLIPTHVGQTTPSLP